jgi:hypothetical protein
MAVLIFFTDLEEIYISFESVAKSFGILDCGGKRSATPLWNKPVDWLATKSSVAAALCRSSPKTFINP